MTQTAVRSDAELVAVDENILMLAEAGALAKFCAANLRRRDDVHSAERMDEYHEQVRLAVRLLPERKSEARESNAQLFDALMAADSGNPNFRDVVVGYAGGCSEQTASDLHAYAQEAEHMARVLMEKRESTIFIHAVRKAVSAVTN